MARKLSTPQETDLALFVRHLYAAGGFASWADFARESGFPATNLSNVQNGKAGIDGSNLLDLIRASARRAELSDDAAAILAARDSVGVGDSRSLERRLEALADAVARGFEALGVAPELLRPAEDGPSHIAQADQP